MSRMIFVVFCAICSLMVIPSLAAPAYANQAQVQASIGIVLDVSNSMRPKREAAVKAIKQLLEQSNQQDEFFIVDFNEAVRLDQDFTADRQRLNAVLEWPNTGGGTALYDAINFALDHMSKHETSSPRAIVIISDGGDNQSHIRREDVLKHWRTLPEIKMFSVGFFEPGDDTAAAEFMRKLAKETGGQAIFAYKKKMIDQQLSEFVSQIANEISTR